MTQALVEGKKTPGDLKKVLEVGTGCGYQTMVLAPLVGTIFTIERIRDLMLATKTRLSGLGVHNVRYRHGDGMLGWPGQAPFDGILVAAAPSAVPEALREQLDIGGRLIIPIGPPGLQELVRITRSRSGYERESLCAVSFVPLLEGTG